MEQPVVANPADQAQMAAVRTVMAYESQIRGGTSWFYWIAGLSILNSVIYFAGGSINFVVGLAFTQFIDGFVQAFSSDASPVLSTIVHVFGFGLDLILAGLFALCGYLGRKRYRWVVVGGMVLYVLDGLLFAAFSEWLAVIFHVWALASLWRGLTAINQLTQLEKSQSAGDQAAVQMLLALERPVNPAAARQNLVRFALMISIPFVLLLGYLLYAVFVNPP